MTAPAGVERRKVWLVGLDQVTVSGADNIRKVLDSGDVERLISDTRSLSDLPFWARCFFPVTRFFSDEYGWFLPFISNADASYPPCRQFLDQKFAQRGFLSADVTAAADLLGAEEPASDDALIKVYVQAVQRYFTPDKPVPDSIFDAANKQLNTPVESFLPWRRWPSSSGTSTIYSYASDSRESIPGAEGLPKKCVVDIAHVVLALQKNAPAVLRAIAADPDSDPGTVFARASPNTTSSILRIAARDGTLGGLLPADDPAVAGKTVVELRISSAAVETGDKLWAFSDGTAPRACAAMPALLDFAGAVQEELRRRRDTA